MILPEALGSEPKTMDSSMLPIFARLELRLANMAARMRTIPSDRRGYLDPGSGSYLLQVAMAGILGAAFTLKSYWGRIKAAIRTKLNR
jgi:hypothetical protein